MCKAAVSPESEVGVCIEILTKVFALENMNMNWKYMNVSLLAS